jgi:hypothetical protein
MKWAGADTNAVYQRTGEGESKAFRYLYIWEESAGKWRAGRYTLGREIDFLAESFTTAKKARAYCELYDKEKAETIIEGVTA